MKYKVIKRGFPGAASGGPQKYYAIPVYSGEISLSQMGRKLSASSTVTKTDAVAVLSGLTDLIAEELKDGKIVRLGELGSFRISLNSNGEESVENVSSRSIKKARVLFKPGKEFADNLVGLSFEKAKQITANPDEEIVDNLDSDDQAT